MSICVTHASFGAPERETVLDGVITKSKSTRHKPKAPQGHQRQVTAGYIALPPMRMWRRRKICRQQLHHLHQGGAPTVYNWLRRGAFLSPRQRNILCENYASTGRIVSGLTSTLFDWMSSLISDHYFLLHLLPITSKSHCFTWPISWSSEA